MKIFTHMAVDLDAVCSVWAARRFIAGAADAAVEFRPANWDGAGMSEGDLALDMAAGGRGLKGRQAEDGTVHSCFASLVAAHVSAGDQSVLARLVRFVDAQDAHGCALKILAPGASSEEQKALGATSLNAVLTALHTVHPGDDAVVVERMSEILSGMLEAGRARRRAALEADEAEIIGGSVAVVANARELATNGILFERGVRVVVYRDGNNLGLIREFSEELRMDHPEIRAVVEAAGEASEWFAHPAGFLFCRGSRKAPATSASRVDALALAEVIVRLLA